MEEWISQNWLALYGAITGTIALFISISRFVHTVNKDKVKLKFTIGDHPYKEENIKRMHESNNKESFEQINSVSIYSLSIRNIGNVDAHIEDAWIICKNKKVHKILVSEPDDRYFLSDISQSEPIKISPKSSTKIHASLGKDDDIFHAEKAVIVDSTGKQWRTNA